MRKLLLAAVLAVGSGCCVSKTELAADVDAWRSFTDAVEPDLIRLYGEMKEPTRTTRLGLLDDNRDAIADATSRSRGAR